MTLAELELSLKLHERRHRCASEQLGRTCRGAQSDGELSAGEASDIHRLERRVSHERALVLRRREQIEAKRIGLGTLFLPGVTKVLGNHAGVFVASPPKLVWHTTEGASVDAAVGAYRRHNSWPHVTLNPKTGQLVQHLPLNRAGRSLEHPAGTAETNRAHAIQVALVGFARESHDWGPERYASIADLARKIERATGVPRRAFVTFSLGGWRLSESAWIRGAGHCGHQHVPHNTHSDPGALRVDLIL